MISGGPRPGWRTELPRLAAALLVVALAGLVAMLIALGLTRVDTTGQAGAELPRVATPQPSPLPLLDVGRDALSRIVTVEAERATDESLGTGWLIDSNCDYVTNAHVVYGEQTLRLTDGTDHTHPAVVAGVDEAADIAVLHCTDGYQPGSPLPVDAATLDSTAMPVVVLASSRATGHQDMTLETIVALDQDVPLIPSQSDTDPAIPTHYHDMLELSGNRIYQGNSGGPVLDQEGQVVGIVTLSSPTSRQAYAIPLSRVLPELEQLDHTA